MNLSCSIVQCSEKNNFRCGRVIKEITIKLYFFSGYSFRKSDTQGNLGYFLV